MSVAVAAVNRLYNSVVPTSDSQLQSTFLNRNQTVEDHKAGQESVSR